MKLQTAFFFILFSSAATQSNAQVLAVSAGLATDLNNQKPFYSIPICVQLEPFHFSTFFIEVNDDIAFNHSSQVDAYTTNAQLPEHVALRQQINLNSLAVGIGWKIKIYTTKKKNRFSLNLSWGVNTDYFRLHYKNYDAENYEVLNPDVSNNLSGLYASAAAVYSFHKGRRDRFVMLRIQSPSTARFQRYELSYNKTAPLQLTYGYNLF